MELQLFRKLIIELTQEFHELLVAMARKALANDFTFQDLQRGE